ncbi:MAG: hypothetical protein J5742_01610 [Alphaproteobacteria bacterium]|nr:hypothetical protein [Alphaproteobacteria bacterium]
MKKFIKKYLKFIIGICVLLLAVFLFATMSRKSTSLETGTLKDWRDASVERRIAAAKILTASENDLNLLVSCVDKMATLPESSNMPVRDATELCFVGIKLKENI